MEEWAVLISAITDVGQWRWWTSELPALVQLEFGGVQIYKPPADLRSVRDSSVIGRTSLKIA